MFKSLVTLFRGTAHEVAENVKDRNVFAILDQQLRDCTRAVEQARKALAVAMAQKEKEKAHLAKTRERIADLECRAGEALDTGNEELALEAAEAIAYLEADREASEKAQATFAVETTRLRAIVKQSEMRLVELRRGQRIAVAAEKTNRLRGDEITSGCLSASSLAEAEQTLARLRERQDDFERTRTALDSLDPAISPASLSERMAEAGFGPSTRVTADDVMDRLKRRGASIPTPAKPSNSTKNTK